MKKYLSKISALFLCSVLFTGGLSAGATYAPEDFTISLRAMNGGDIPESNANKIYVSPEDAEKGTTLHFGVYLEAEKEDLVILTTHIQSESDMITFDSSTFQTPSNPAYSEAQSFTLPDGTTFSTKFKPYCVGAINSIGNYTPNASGCLPNISEQLLKFTWMANYENTGGLVTNTAHFLGGASDYFSFIEFDMNIAAGTASGVYPITFLTNEDYPDRATSVSSDVSIPDPNPDHAGMVLTKYADVIPTLKHAEIVIAEKPPALETDIQSCFRFADDDTPFTIEDFPSETSISYGGDSLTFRTDDLLEFFTAGSPAEMDIEMPVTLQSELSLSGMEIQTSDGSPASLAYRVGMKGDANLDGIVDSKDAAAVLRYAADIGSGQASALTEEGDTETERFAYFLADIDGESRDSGEDGSELTAGDAGKILLYAAGNGSGDPVDWESMK